MRHRKALDVAVAFLERATVAGDEPPSNMKLLKLLYYAQGLHLAAHHHSLFADKVEAWQFGPVVKEVWSTFSEYRDRPIRRFAPATYEIDPQDRITVALVYEVYGHVSAGTLSEWTHQEMPWRAVARHQGVITQSAMQKYFSQPKVAESVETESQMLCRLSAQHALGIVAIPEIVGVLGSKWTDDLVVEYLSEYSWLKGAERSRNGSAGNDHWLAALPVRNFAEVAAKLEIIRRDNRSDEYGTPERFDLEVIASQEIEGIDARPYLPGRVLGQG